MIPVWVLVIVLHTGIDPVAIYPHDTFGYLQCELDKERAEKYYLTPFSCVQQGKA